MLPRFVRAMQTGTTIFTMDIINGHYLGDRKATRDPECLSTPTKDSVFASSHLIVFSLYLHHKQTSRGESLFPPPLSLPDLAGKA
ncbi:hypothetical protein CPB85DRAFT_1290868, partial [Mucidula mucida]